MIKDCNADYPLPTATVPPVFPQAELGGAAGARASGPSASGPSAAPRGALSPEEPGARAAGPLPAPTQGAAAHGFEARQGPPRRAALPGTAECGWRRGTERSPQLPRGCIVSPAAGWLELLQPPSPIFSIWLRQSPQRAVQKRRPAAEIPVLS